MADQNSKPMCLTCRFFVNQTPYGACQRYPSIVQKHEMSWCGEYAAVVTEFKSAFPIKVDSDEDLMFVNKKRERPAKAA